MKIERILSSLHELFILPFCTGVGKSNPPLIFGPLMVNVHKFSRKAIHLANTFNFSPFKVISGCNEGHNHCLKRNDRFSLKNRHWRNNSLIELNFVMHFQNKVLLIYNPFFLKKLRSTAPDLPTPCNKGLTTFKF